MRNFAWTLSLIFGAGLAACSSDTTAAPGTTVDGGAPDGAIVSTPPVRNRSLGMNDVSFLVPLPTDDNAVLFRASDPSADGSPFLSEALFTRVTTVDGHGPAELSVPHKYLQITAVRFDVCDRNTSAPCGPNEDGRLRVVFQPVAQSSANDFGIHVFYNVPRSQLASVIADLRALAAIQAEPMTAPLKINPALARESQDGPYHTKLRTLLSTYAAGSKISRVTVMGQSQIAAAFRWIFSGMEREDTTMDFHPIGIPGSGNQAPATAIDVLLLSDTDYELTPSIDAPAGMSPALKKTTFAAASPAQRDAALRALVGAENPSIGAPATVQCATCHLSTLLVPKRAAEQGLDPSQIPGRFTAPYDLQVTTPSAVSDDGLLRGFGWRNKTAGISARVVNETAQVLSDCEKQFPAM